MVFDIILGLQQKLAKQWYNYRDNKMVWVLPLAFQETDVNELRQKVEELQEQQGSQSPELRHGQSPKWSDMTTTKMKGWNPYELIWYEFTWGPLKIGLHANSLWGIMCIMDLHKII